MAQFAMNKIETTSNVTSLEEGESKRAITTAILQNIGKQDYIVTGEANDDTNTENSMFQFIVVIDGHGNSGFGTETQNKTLNILKNIEWNMLLGIKDWQAGIFAMIGERDTKYSGATLSIIKIYNTHFDCWWVGDSSIKIYSEGEEYWAMRDHCSCNWEKIDEQKNKGFNVIREMKPEILTPNTITMVESYRVQLNFHEKIAMSHSMGHNSATGTKFEYQRLSRKPQKSYRVIVASDGLWDVVCKNDAMILSDKKLVPTAQDIMIWCVERWRQEWNYVFKNYPIQKTRFPESNRDDIAIAVWDSD